MQNHFSQYSYTSQWMLLSYLEITSASSEIYSKPPSGMTTAQATTRMIRKRLVYPVALNMRASKSQGWEDMMSSNCLSVFVGRMLWKQYLGEHWSESSTRTDSPEVQLPNALKSPKDTQTSILASKSDAVLQAEDSHTPLQGTPRAGRNLCQYFKSG